MVQRPDWPALRRSAARAWPLTGLRPFAFRGIVGDGDLRRVRPRKHPAVRRSAARAWPLAGLRPFASWGSRHPRRLVPSLSATCVSPTKRPNGSSRAREAAMHRDSGSSSRQDAVAAPGPCGRATAAMHRDHRRPRLPIRARGSRRHNRPRSSIEPSMRRHRDLR
jgi:hypothetical protein